MPFPFVVPLALVGAGWSIRAYADHNIAKDAEEAESDDEADEMDAMEVNAESVWSAITNTEGLF
jgi:hypothetical protein